MKIRDRKIILEKNKAKKFSTLFHKCIYIQTICPRLQLQLWQGAQIWPFMGDQFNSKVCMWIRVEYLSFWHFFGLCSTPPPDIGWTCPNNPYFSFSSFRLKDWFFSEPSTENTIGNLICTEFTNPSPIASLVSIRYAVNPHTKDIWNHKNIYIINPKNCIKILQFFGKFTLAIVIENEQYVWKNSFYWMISVNCFETMQSKPCGGLEKVFR